MADILKIPGLHLLTERTKGDERICVAVLDGAVDLKHPSLAGANLTVRPVLGESEATVARRDGAVSRRAENVGQASGLRAT